MTDFRPPPDLRPTSAGRRSTTSSHLRPPLGAEVERAEVDGSSSAHQIGRRSESPTERHIDHPQTSDKPSTEEPESVKRLCRFRAKFPTRRSALVGAMPGTVVYHCPQHDCWHVRIDLTTQPESDTP